MEQSKNRGMAYKLAIVCLGILLLGSFWVAVRGTSESVSLAVIPVAPRKGEPVMATFKLNNPSSETVDTYYQFYADGQLLKEGTATIAPGSGKSYQYVYANPLQLGERLNFMVRTQSELGNGEEIVSSPPYPPQIWSSFISFASFSTSVMSHMSGMPYYQGTFGSDGGLNVGIIATVVLVILLIFLELSEPMVQGETMALGRLRLRFSTATWVLFIIFMGIVFTRVILIISV